MIWERLRDKGRAYPGDYLDEGERGCHAEYVVHADGKVERAGAVEVRAVLFQSS